MPYAPTERNQIPEIIGSTAQSLEGDFRTALQRYQDNKKQTDLNRGTLEGILQADPNREDPAKALVAPDQVAKWDSLNPDRQSGIIALAAARLKENQAFDQRKQLNQLGDVAQSLLQQQRITAEAPLRTAQVTNLNAEAAARTATTATAAAAAKNANQPIYANDSKTQVGIYDSEGTPRYFPAGAIEKSEPIQTDPLIDPVSKQPVPGVGVVRKTGAVVPTNSEIPQVITDPTNRFYYDNKNRSWKPLQVHPVDPQKQAIADLLTGAAPGSAPNATGTPPAAATPAPAATTAPVRVQSLDQARALAPGTPFYDTNGILRVR